MRIAIAVAALTTVASFVPANAAYPDSGGGMTCGMVAQLASGQPQDPRQIWQATMTGGPWFAPWEHPDAVVVVKCTVVALQEGHPPEVLSQVTSPPSTAMGLIPPTPSQFTIPVPDVPIALCTEVTVYWNATPHVYLGDADDNPANGAQCEPAPDQSSEAGHIRVVSPRPGGGEICAGVEHPYYPPVPKGACPPIGY